MTIPAASASKIATAASTSAPAKVESAGTMSSAPERTTMTAMSVVASENSATRRAQMASREAGCSAMRRRTIPFTLVNYTKFAAQPAAQRDRDFARDRQHTNECGANRRRAALRPETLPPTARAAKRGGRVRRGPRHYRRAKAARLVLGRIRRLEVPGAQDDDPTRQETGPRKRRKEGTRPVSASKPEPAHSELARNRKTCRAAVAP